MAYNPNIYNPYNATIPWSSQQVNGIVYVKDLDAAKEYQMGPNSVSPPLMLQSDNIFIIKSTDGSGGGTLTAYKFEEIPLKDLSVPQSDYVTKADFEAFTNKMMEVINGKYPATTQPPQPATTN